MKLYKAVPAIAAAGILFFIVLSSNPALLASELAKSDIRYILLAFGAATAAAFLRVLKWSVLVGIGVRRLFPIQFLGFTISNFTPGKIAEPLKAVLLKMRYGVSVSKSLPSIIWERINDLIVLIALSATAIQALTLEKNMLFIGALSIGVFAAMIAVFIAIVRSDRLGTRLFRFISRFPAMKGISQNFIETFYKSRTRKRTILLSLAITLIPWVLEGYIFYFALLAVGIMSEPLALAGIIALAVLVGVMSSLPGGLGSFEAVVIILLGVADISGTKAVAGLILYRFLSFWYATFLGWLSFMHLSRHLDVKGILKL